MKPTYTYIDKEYTTCGDWCWTKSVTKPGFYWAYHEVSLPNFSVGIYAVVDDFGNMVGARP